MFWNLSQSLAMSDYTSSNEYETFIDDSMLNTLSVNKA